MTEVMADATNGIEEVTAKETSNNTEGTITYSFGANLSEMIEKYGEEAIYNAAKAQVKVGLQAAMRRALVAGRSLDELVDWKPGMVFRDTNPLNTIMKTFANLSPEEKAIIAQKMGLIPA